LLGAAGVQQMKGADEPLPTEQGLKPQQILTAGKKPIADEPLPTEQGLKHHEEHDRPGGARTPMSRFQQNKD